MSELILEERFELRQPALLCAFSGWPDAAESASRAIGFLRAKLGAVRLGEIAAESFYSLTDTRPQIAVRDGLMRSLIYPNSPIYCWRNPRRSGRDLLFIQAAEPNLRWPAYVEAVIELAQRCGVSGVYSMGSLFDGVPHTRPTRISMAAAQPEMRVRLLKLGAAAVDYEGPGSIHTALLDECRRRQIPAASFWGHVPAYAQVNWSPRVTLALLEALLATLEMAFDLSSLRDQATQLDALLDRLVESDEDLRRQLLDFEERFDQERVEGTSPLPSTEAVLNEVEWLLRKGQDDTASD